MTGVTAQVEVITKSHEPRSRVPPPHFERALALKALEHVEAAVYWQTYDAFARVSMPLAQYSMVVSP